MGNYMYTDGDGDKLGMHSFQDERVHVIAQSRSGRVVPVYIPNADVPTVAAELLKAAGQESVIVPMNSLPSYGFGDDTLYFLEPDDSRYAIDAHEDPATLRCRAYANLAAAEVIELRAAQEAAEKAEAEAAETKLQERRDAIALVLSETGRAFDTAYPMTRRAIDRIIELEDKLAAK